MYQFPQVLNLQKLTLILSICLAPPLLADVAQGPATSSSTASNTSDIELSRGRVVFQQSCQSCHSGGIAGWFMDAPALGDKEQWGQLAAKGPAALLASTTNGSGAMPAMGGCDSCSEDQLQAAIQYMLQQSQ